MANVFGSAITDSTGQPGQGTRSLAHARTRTTWSRFAAGTPADGDLLVIGYFKSNDQIIDVRFYTDGGGTAGAFDLGFLVAEFRDGATTLSDSADSDCFATAKATGTAILHGSATATVFTEASLDDFDRGKAAHTLAGVAADPGQTYALVAEVTTTVDGANEMAFEVEYVAGD